jgi:hypothetical protein
MKPIIILPPDSVSEGDIKLLNDNDLCVVVAKDPAAIKFVDPIPSMSSRTEIEDAAIKLSRRILHRQVVKDNMGNISPAAITGLFVQLLTEGTPLGADETQAEREAHIFRREKEAEIVRLAREEAKAERAAKKAGVKK